MHLSSRRQSMLIAPHSSSLVGKRTKSWLSIGAKLTGRQLICQLMCRRLTLLIVWTLLVIFMLYKSLYTESEIPREKTAEFVIGRAGDEAVSGRYTSAGRPLELTGDLQEKVSLQADVQQLRGSTSASVITKVPNHNAMLSTTKKSQADEYIRRSKVFILIIQDENLRPTAYNQPSRRSASAGDRASRASTFSSQSVRFTVPAHIRLLIDILESHKIEFTIDSTRTGLPTALLNDQDNASERKQFSVIVIDDFVKYTKLSRWARDQLDRHCRMNRIGVIAFLGPDMNLSENHRYLKRNKGMNRLTSRSLEASSSEESLADQFPITFKAMAKQKGCQNSSCATVDYQVNEESPILRILKRRKNFIIGGPVAASVNEAPWMTMSSNHVTYQPLVWARFKSKASGSDSNNNLIYASTVIQSQQIATVSSPASSTQERNHNISSDLEAKQKGDIEQSKANKSADPDEYEMRDPLSEYMATKDYYEPQRRSSAKLPLTDSAMNIHDTSSFPDTSEVSGGNSNAILADESERQVLSMLDQGLYDGIKRVLFGGINQHWLHRVLILDAIEHLSSGRILDPLERYIQIDIDDIFVAERGKRMKLKDVDALLETQRDFAGRIAGGFKFNLGFSGKYFEHGLEDENLGDRRLVELAEHFYWFCHTWSHSKAHLSNEAHNIEEELRRNLKFAHEHGLPIIGRGVENGNGHGATNESIRPSPTYAVAPHHSGVYPIHDQLYEAWNRVLNVQVTSTEEYPHLRPASARRAFVHRTIKVLPRQTCGLYTHTVQRDKYPGGIERLNGIIRGGELFETILHNPVNIYMTHMSNYANDRLAPYTFGALIDFVQANTNLQLRYVPSNGDAGCPSNQLGPAVLADLYFKLFPIERQPLWTNPCDDKRHLAIWADNKHRYCSHVPRLLIVGPQKTGTTALHTFLKLNPIFKSSHPSAEDFEEVQFFNDKHYYQGVDWYFSKFIPQTSNGTELTPESADETLFFDKSATYFDDLKVPQRASVLLPDASIVIVLVDPADRAYSWYQHMKAHGDEAASSMTFDQLISSGAPLNGAAKTLLSRCLHPGYYAQHISRWLDYYSSRRIIIIDGQWFKRNPASVMNKLQLLLRVRQPLDYRRLLVYSEQKGFYCVQEQQTGAAHRLKCLGKSKGRAYPPMSQAARTFLNRHFRPHNRNLARILSDIGQPLPVWLNEALGPTHSVIY